MLMLMEELFNIPLMSLSRIEKITNKAYKNQIYMNFLMFVNSEILNKIEKQIYKPFDDDDDDNNHNEDDVLKYNII